MSLGHREWNQLLQAVKEVYFEVDPSATVSRSLSSARRLFGSEITAFDFFSESGVHTGEYSYAPDGFVTASEFAIFAELAHDHPFAKLVFGERMLGVHSISDLLSLEQFKKTPIYNEYYRIYGIDHQIVAAFSTQPNEILTCAYSRCGGDFTSTEREMLSLLVPHVTNAIRNSRKMQELNATVDDLSFALETRSCGVVSLDRELKILYISHFCTTLIEKYLGNGSLDGGTLPELLLGWIRQNDPTIQNGIPRVPSTLKLDLPNSTLSVTIMFDEKRDERFLILEESRESGPSDFQILGLTKRQAEILFWLSRGKTDRDIGEILCISHRTVHKHLEAIYTHLGVETRTAAMQIALSAVKS